MEPKNGKPDAESVPQRAAEYFLELQSGDQSSDERAQVVDWLRESPEHVSELLRTAHLHRRLASFRRWSDVKRGDADAAANGDGASVVAFQPVRLPRPKRSLAMPLALAASVIVLTAAAVLFIRSRQEILTTADQWRQVALADGSRVDLAPDSDIRPAYSSNMRMVYLERGEALFEVQKNRQRPFLVVAGNTVVRAVGTAFDVNRRQHDQIAVTVVEGVIQLRAERSPDLKRLLNAPRADTQLSLHANEAVLISAISGEAAPVHQVTARTEVSWATGELEFDNETVASVVQSFNRFNARHIVVTDSAIAGRRVSGSFRANDPDSFVAFLVNTSNVRVSVRGGQLLIERK